jgi:Lar family restriction alleviation protein
MSMGTELKPDLSNCPFCGAAPELVAREEGPLLRGAYVICDECKTSNGIYTTAAEAIAAWNRRALSSSASEGEPVAKRLHRDEVIDLISPLSNNSADHDIEFANRVMDAMLSASPLPQEPREAEQVCAEAYQVVGSLLSDLGRFDMPEAQRILDNLSQARLVHTNVLPWPSYEPREAALTDEEIDAIAMQHCGDLWGGRLCMARDQRIAFARAIERELRGAQEVKAGEWLPIETAPKEQGAEVLGWFRKVKLDEDDNLTDEVVGGAIAQVSRNGDGWDEPDWLNASGAYFFDDWSFEPEPVLWHPLPAPPSTNESADSRGEKG